MKFIVAAAALLALGVVGGCAPLAVPSLAGDAVVDTRTRRDAQSSVATSTDADLAAVLMPTGADLAESLTLRLDRPAYTAVFRVVPGQGAMMIYPRPGFGASDGYLFSGIHRLVTAGAGMSFVSSLNGMLSASAPLPGAHDPDFGPEYYFVVASDRPLRFDGALFGGAWQYQSAAGYPTMQWLVSQTIPERSAAGWTTDYFVHWPGTVAATSQQGFVSLTCDGSRVWVDPARYERAVQALCREGGLPPGPGASPQNPTAVDPDGIVTPRRRQPETDAVRLSSRQLEDPLGWEAARRDATGVRSAQGGRIFPPAAPPLEAPRPAEPARRNADTEAAPGGAADGTGRSRPLPTDAAVVPSAADREAVEAGRRREGVVDPPAPQGTVSTSSSSPAEPVSGSDAPRMRPGIDSAAEDPIRAPSPTLRGEDPVQPRLRPTSLDPMMPGSAEPGRIGPGYQFPVDPAQTDPWTLPVEPAAVGMPPPPLGTPDPPSRREPLPTAVPQAAPAPADGGSEETPRVRPDL